jgi:RNA polymerase sigma-70 factor (ECF subfamily)
LDTTPVSLLQRLRQPNEQAAWARFVEIYLPLLLGWARRLGLQEADAADLVQDVFATLVQKMPSFEHDPGKSFRAWLHTILVNRWRDWQRRRACQPRQAGEAVLAAVAADVEPISETEYRQQLVKRTLELMRDGFKPTTWQAFWEHGVKGRAAAAVAAELGISIGAVYAARCRVMAQVREELRGLID